MNNPVKKLQTGLEKFNLQSDPDIFAGFNPDLYYNTSFDHENTQANSHIFQPEYRLAQDLLQKDPNEYLRLRREGLTDWDIGHLIRQTSRSPHE